MDPELKALLEALLFAADEPLSLRRLASLLPEHAPAELRSAILALNEEYEAAGHAVRVVEIAGGYQLLTQPVFAPWIARLVTRQARTRLSQPALETLAIVAYRQPVARADLEAIRGVNVEAVLKTLVERDLITIVGRDEGLGRPLLYGTTDAFLSYFGLNDLADLPRVDELEVFLARREQALLAEAPPEAPPEGSQTPGELHGATPPELGESRAIPPSEQDDPHAEPSTLHDPARLSSVEGPVART